MKKYTIKKGRHYPSGLYFKPYKGSDVVIFGKFNLDCWHYPDDIPEPCKNKLTGITFGWKGVHKNSIRIAWQPDTEQNKINLFVYYYNQGIRKIDQISEVQVGEKFMIRIIFGNDSLKIRFGVFEKKYLFSIPDTTINYFNFPYFGGNSKAPWDMNIEMNVQETCKNQ